MDEYSKITQNVLTQIIIDCCFPFIYWIRTCFFGGGGRGGGREEEMCLFLKTSSLYLVLSKHMEEWQAFNMHFTQCFVVLPSYSIVSQKSFIVELILHFRLGVFV